MAYKIEEHALLRMFATKKYHLLGREVI